MGLIYIGDCTFQESADFVIGVDEFGADSLTRTYEGRTDQLKAFIAKWPKGKTDATFPPFSRRTLQATGRGAFTTVVIQMSGLLDGKIPPAQISGGTRLQTVSLQRFGGQETCEVDYYAPFTTYRYVTHGIPQQPRFPGKIEQSAQAWEFKRTRGSRNTTFHQVIELSRIGGVVTYQKVTTGKFNFARDVSTTISFDPVGETYQVTEENEGIIVWVSDINVPRFISADYQIDINNTLT